ncbi:hypothetical protein [Yeosuana aromativorans]
MIMSSHATKSRDLHKYIVDNGGGNYPNAKFKFGDIFANTFET